MSVRFKNARVEQMPLNTRIFQWNAGTACVSECVLETLACRGLRVGPSKELSHMALFYQNAHQQEETCHSVDRGDSASTAVSKNHPSRNALSFLTT